MGNTFATTQLVDEPRRILALDFGTRNIGLAVSDELGITAQGLPTLRRSNKRNDLDHLRRVIREFHIAELVMGLPLRMSGSEGIQAEKVQVFAEELRRRFKLPVHLFDERLTLVEANRLLRETDMSIRAAQGWWTNWQPCSSCNRSWNFGKIEPCSRSALFVAEQRTTPVLHLNCLFHANVFHISGGADACLCCLVCVGSLAAPETFGDEIRFAATGMEHASHRARSATRRCHSQFRRISHGAVRQGTEAPSRLASTNSMSRPALWRCGAAWCAAISTSRQVTIPEGYNMFDIAAAIEQAGLGPAADFIGAARHRDVFLLRGHRSAGAVARRISVPYTYAVHPHDIGARHGRSDGAPLPPGSADHRTLAMTDTIGW